MLPALERLREAAAEHDARVAALPYARALTDGTLPPERRGSLLRAVWIVAAELARALPRASDPRVAALERALDARAVDRHGVDEAACAALLATQQLRRAAQRGDRAWLLGFAAALDAAPLARLLPDAALPPPALSSVDDAALDGARAAFAALEAAAGGAGRRAGGEEWLASELNPHAGTHPVPADLRELEAALRAGEETWGRFAYYGARYGDRGRLFTGSDAAWLATLAREDATTTARQIHWLARVLAARGMPRLLLEVHLDHLAAALTARLPERAARYRSLAAVARELREQRLGAIDEVRAGELVERFAAGRAPEAGLGAVEAATLLVAAVTDEAQQVPGAVKALAGWLADPARFSAEWCGAVDRLLAAARAAALRERTGG